MKPEPLKGKRVICQEYLDADCFDYEDVKLAVEWLKEEIRNSKYYNIIVLIDKAFEDVVKGD